MMNKAVLTIFNAEHIYHSMVAYWDELTDGDMLGVDSPRDAVMALLFYVIMSIAAVVIYFILAKVCFAISRKIFRFLEKKHGKKIHIQFAENLVHIVIIFLFIVVPLAGDRIRQSILSSAAVMAAVVGIACQDIIKDTLSGLMISIYKPFDIGDRIELDDGTSGIVESITMRHVVLRVIDTVRLVIPNSKLNVSTVKNLSFGYVPRSVEFSFPVSYDTDVAKAKKVIFQAIEESTYSIPGKRDKAGSEMYGPIYFFALDDSAFIMRATVYYNPDTPTEVLKDDVNTRVVEALRSNGIEIPYRYANVVMKKERAEQG